ncbi:type I-C CRISPR-associated protein Cas8c/Csd1 [Bathymodiolus platifrons methanotrophic gill symbiont]|uniref:type I-C CRISPR-associated protein Cas8c/Csd1 n=1 Tax=Bathymodiolus platifrons methanotrophic gill symbiont TaxID=113268 RepID=UPI001C8E1294|nr:type I-C CRISPR-associated protein Cas8c/Csd1 [Bathymodiolus platifrons methanotrophic gill symbiont]
MQPNVNPQHPEAAYHCGRLLAILARLQYAALGDVGAGVIQRYYTATSQTPALLIGRLIANAKNHLNKLEGGLGFWYEDKIAETMSALGDSIPKTLTLEKQSLFALGYYQQLAEMKKKKTDIQSETKTGSGLNLLFHLNN